MPPVIAAAGIFLQGVGIAVASAVGGLAAGASLGIGAAVALGGAVVAGAALVASKAVNSLFAVDMPQVDSDASRQRTVKSTTEPFKTVYGETLVSGPITYIGMAGTDNADLYHVIALAGHEVTDIKDVYFDNKLISDAQINSGNAAGGNVIAGDFGPKGGSTICVINKHLGTATQAADSMMVSTFSDYTSAHQGKNVAYLAMKWTLNDDSAQTWEQLAPSDIKAIVKGRKVYDPRLDVAAGNAAGANPANASYIAYSTNPALCLADYLINSEFGLGVGANKVDWPAIVTAANGCDVSVAVPGGTESRFTCNGVLFGTDSHRTNINKILSSMNGTLVYSNGVYILRAGIYEAPTQSLNEDDLISAIGIKTSFERSDRFNTIKGLFVDPAQNHKSSEFPKVQLADAVERDNGEVLEKEMQFPMTNSSYGAQRIANKLIQLSDQQKVVTFPANLSALRITAGDRVQVSIDELNWNDKIFQCVGWTFADDGGVNLTLREDSATSYADPTSTEYSTISATGVITDAFRGIPSPSGLSATAGLKNNQLDWVNPRRPSDFATIHVFASPNANFSSAVKIGETDGSKIIHDEANGIDSVSPGDLRYYWVRAVKNVGTDAASQSNLEPNADPNTSVFATVGRVVWEDVSGSPNAPEDNATVGAELGEDVFASDGTTVVQESDVLNSVLAQQILEVEIEAGEVLNLETGADVDIQNLGDVAIYVSNQDAVIQSNINTVSLGLSNLENTIVDLTSGVSDIYIQTTAPVPGQGGIPNPIPDFSRWYDSDDDNHPYYWTGSAWVSLEDPRIGSNASAITNLTSSLATTNTNVSGNSTSITALNTLTVSQGNSLTSLSGSVTALESTVNNATTGVSANATGLSNLTTRVTTAEGTITTQSSDISTLTADLDQAETDIGTKASSSALDALDVRVTSAESTITTQSTDITALESTVDDGATGVAANAAGLTALSTRVTTAEDDIDINSSAVTSLDATYTTDLNYRTKAADENNDLIDLETSGTVDLQELTDFVSASSAATQALTVRTTASEDSLVTQASDITALQSTVNDPANGVSATATGLSNLSTSVSVIDGAVSTISTDLTSLTTTVGGNTTSISTQSESIDGVEANYTVKIDNNNRIAGFGLLSTTSGSTPFSEFAVVADQFSIVDPSSTAANPVQPFTVTAQKVHFGTDVVVSGDLVTTGTVSADYLDVTGVITAGSLITSSATISNDIRIGSGESVFSADENGIYLGNETFANAEFKVSPTGALTASSATLTGNVTASSFTLATGATLSDADGAISNAQQLMSAVTGIIDANQHAIPSFWRITTDDNEAPSNSEFNTVAGRLAKVNDLVITTDTTVTDPVTPNRTYGWTCTTAGTATAEAVWSAITNFMSGDLLVDGSVSAEQINASSVASALITAGNLIVENDLTDTTTIISGGNILTGTILADYIDVSGVVTAGNIITDSATIGNDIRIGSGESVFSADSAGIYLGNTTFDDAEFRVTPAGALTAASVNITGTVDASTDFTFDGANVTGTMPAGNLDVAGIVTAGSLITDSATISNDIRIGSGEAVFSADSAGIYLGNTTFDDAEFRVTPAGALTASSATLTGNVTASTFTLTSGATLSDADGVITNADQVMSDVTGVVSAAQHDIPSFWRVTTDDSAAPDNAEFNTVAGRLAKVNDLVISTDTTTDPDTTYAWICTVAGATSTEATWSAITNFISGDLIVDGSVKAEAIAANAVTAEKVNVTSLSAISADMGTITAGTIKTAASGYRVEVSDTGDFPIWYGTGTKTAANGLFYVKDDGSVYINAVIEAQAGSSIATFDAAIFFSQTVFGTSSSPVTVTSSSSNLSYTYYNGSGNYSYAWTLQATTSGNEPTISSTTTQLPTFSATVAMGTPSVSVWEVLITDTDTSAITRESVYITLTNIGPLGGGA